MGINYSIDIGQMVRIKLEGLEIFTGIVVDKPRIKIDGGNTARYDYSCSSLKSLYGKNTDDEKYDANEEMLNIFENHEVADIDVDQSIDDEINESYNTEGTTLYELYDSLSNQVGKTWLIEDFTLKLIDIPSSIIDSDYNIDPLFTNFRDYRVVQISDDFDNFANNTFLFGAEYKGATLKYRYFDDQSYDDFISISGYQSGLVEVVSDTNIKRYSSKRIADAGTVEDFIYDNLNSPLGEDVERGDMIYNKTLDEITFVSTITFQSTTSVRYYVSPPVTGQTQSDLIWYNWNMKNSAKQLLESKGGFPPLAANFESNTNGFNVRTRILINLPEMDCNRYFNISSVNISDLGAGIFNFQVTAESINYGRLNILKRNNFLKLWRRM